MNKEMLRQKLERQFGVKLPRERTDGKHAHTCECGAIWEHSNSLQGTQDENPERFYAAHTCPRCGVTQYHPEGYHGDDMVPNCSHRDRRLS